MLLKDDSRNRGIKRYGTAAGNDERWIQIVSRKRCSSIHWKHQGYSLVKCTNAYRAEASLCGEELAFERSILCKCVGIRNAPLAGASDVDTSTNAS